MRLEPLGYGPGRSSVPLQVASTVAFVVGGLLVLWSGTLHFHLWQKVGYRHIPTIGPLYLVQSVAAVVVGVLVIAVRRVWVAIAGAGFALSTMVGFLISVEHGLFGFKDSWSAPFAHQALAVDIAAIVVLAAAGGLCLYGPTSVHPSTRPSGTEASSGLATAPNT